MSENSSTGIVLPKKLIRILAIVEGMTPTTSLVITIPLNKLQSEGMIAYHIISVHDIITKPVKEIYINYDIIILLRLCSEQAVQNILMPCLALQKKIIYMLDDDLASLEPTTPVGMIYYSMRPKENIEKFCTHANFVFLFSLGLYEKYKGFNKNTLYMKSPSNIEIVYNNVASPRIARNNNVVTIGYAAGPHHLSDFLIVCGSLQRLLEEYKENIIFECFFDVKPPQLMSYANVLALKSQTNIDAFYSLLACRQWDIGVAPLPITQFHSCKSNNKYREYAAFKIAGVYTNILPYNTCITHESNGLLSNNTSEDWYKNIKRLIDDKELRNLIIENAHKDAVATYSLQTILTDYRCILNGLC